MRVCRQNKMPVTGRAMSHTNIGLRNGPFLASAEVLCLWEKSLRIKPANRDELRHIRTLHTVRQIVPHRIGRAKRRSVDVRRFG
jgi:hypothetical protein